MRNAMIALALLLLVRCTDTVAGGDPVDLGSGAASDAGADDSMGDASAGDAGQDTGAGDAVPDVSLGDTVGADATLPDATQPDADVGPAPDSAVDADLPDVLSVDAGQDVAESDGLLQDISTDAPELVDTSSDGAGLDDAQDAGSPDAGPEDAGEPDAGPPPPANLCASHVEAPWSRKTEAVGGAVTFNELMYHPGGDADAEWVELYNPFTIDTDLSGWSLAGGIDYVFPAGTLIPGRGFLIVAASPTQLAAAGVPGALGPWKGKLSNGGELLELRSNGGRRMDALDYDDREPWPVTPDGSGLSLAKSDPLAPSWPAESWSGSAVVGGTPGAPNAAEAGPATSFGPLVPLGASWRFHTTPPPEGWQQPGFDDLTWPVGEAVFYAGASTDAVVTVRATADNYFAAYVGAKDGADLRFVGRDAIGDWQSVEGFEVVVTPADHLYLAGWEAPGDSGSPQMLIGEVELDGQIVMTTRPGGHDAALGPPGANPGGALTDAAPSVEAIAAVVAAKDATQTWSPTVASAPKTAAPWGGVVAGQLASDASYVWTDTLTPNSGTNGQETYALLRSVDPILPKPGATELPTGSATVYLRTDLVVDDPAHTTLWLRAMVDDGAVFSLNGVEVYRQNMPPGPVTATTWAMESVDAAALGDLVPLPSELLVVGANVLSVEVHQAGPDDDDLVFGAEVLAQVWAPPSVAAPPGLLLSEVGAVDAPWVELVNAGPDPLDLGEYALALPTGVVSIPPQLLAPGAYAPLVLPPAGLSAGDKLFLLGDGVIDGVELSGFVRARAQPEPGPWLYPDEPTPGEANVIPLQDAVVINEIHYHAAPLNTPAGPVADDEEWVELHNRTMDPVDVGGWQLVDAIEAQIPPGVTIPPGGFLVVARDPDALLAAHPGVQAVGPFSGRLANSGETLVLRDACGNPVDRVHFLDGGRWPGPADGGGSSLELRNPWIDNEIPEAWAPSVEQGAWQTVSWQGVAQASAVGPDGQWQELVLGLLDDGVALIDDVSVIEDPDGAAIPVVQDGFEGGAGAWRLLGTHRHSSVVPDPDDPANPVLRLVATGAAGHMHNHAETTLLDGATIANGKTYAISMRARWAEGSNQLHGRLYFNRLPRTTLLDRPATAGTPGAPNSTLTPAVGPLFTAFGHSPAVPAPFEPVTVTAQTTDPAGVATMTLWTSVEGGPFEATPMTPEGGRFAAVVGGLPAATIVQMYVEAVDVDGATSTFPAAGPESRALWKVDDGKATDTMHTMRIVMTPQDADWLHADENLMSDDRVGATLIADEQDVFYDVGVRLKGSERGRPQPQRLGFGVAFGADKRFRGVYGSVMIDRSEGVGYGQREMLINLAMTRAGSVSGEYNDLVQVLAPRDVHTGAAELQLARFGSLFLDNQFDAGGDGTLYEYELVYYPTTTKDGTPTGLKLPQPDQVIGTAIKDLGDDREFYRQSFVIDNNNWRDDYGQLMAFAKVFGQQGEEFQAQVGSVIDVDQWLRAFAFATLSGCVDNYASGAQHNAQLYVRPSDQRVLYLPHDLDFFNGSPTSSLVANSDLTKLIAAPQNARLYYGHLWDITETSYNDAAMAHWRDQLGALLPAQPFAAHHQFIVARAAWARTGAPNAVTKAIPPVAFTVEGAAAAGQGLVTVTGQGWVDVREIRAVGGPPGSPPLALEWLDQTHWQAAAPVPCGASTLSVEARGHQGQVVGGGSASAWGGTCP